MTIQRQYSLPNCTLVLEGLGDAIGNPAETRPLMSVLLNAECHLPDQDKPIAGGREFFETFISAVSKYAQEVLSGVHPFVGSDKQVWIELKQIDINHHLLSVRPLDVPPDSGIATQLTRDVTLTTVQLFDLVEAVDQFLADTRTLPDIALTLQPLSKRLTRGGTPITQQAVPATLGASSLALAAIALFFVPAPPVKQPADLMPQSNSATPGTSPPIAGASPTPNTSSSSATNPSPAATAKPTDAATAPQSDLTNLGSILNTAPEITDPAQLSSLGNSLRNQLDKAWKSRQLTQDLIYRVGVAKDNAIVGYKPVNPAALTSANQTPLLDLLYRPAPGSQPTSEAIAQFKVVFTPSGLVEVAPWREAAVTPQATGTEVTDTKSLEELLPKLKQQLVKGLQDKNTSFSKDLAFRVRVKLDGTVVDYRPENQAASDSVKDTPLPNLGKLASENDSPPQEPYALFKVVFTTNGRLELSPWRGWKD